MSYRLEPHKYELAVTASSTAFDPTIVAEVQGYEVDTDGTYTFLFAQNSATIAHYRYKGIQYVGQIQKFTSGPTSAVVTLYCRAKPRLST
jgi:hypothetical protein